MIPLFSRYALTREQAEERLGRPVTGDPVTGEKAALYALAGLDFEHVRQLLDGPGIADDFRLLISDRLEQAIKRDGSRFVVSVLVGGNAYDHYARQGRLQGAPVSAAVAAAVERDFAAARALQQVDADPVLPMLIEYMRELIQLLKTSAGQPGVNADIDRLAELHARLEAAGAMRSEDTRGKE